jgi:hypothetical protein
MKKVMHTSEEVKKLIEQGKVLHLSGNEDVMKKLPKGKWIGGTSSYFMSENGGLISDELIEVTEIPDYITDIKIQYYDSASIKNIYKDGFASGFSIVIIPAFSDTHLIFAKEVYTFEDFASKPLVGWISGVNLGDPNAGTPKVFSGADASISSDKAIVAHFQFPEHKFADVTIFNTYFADGGDEIEFPASGFDTENAFINGKEMNFSDYLTNNKVNIDFPLVANYNGVMINVSFKENDVNAKKVAFFAPVFNGVKYNIAKTKGDYLSAFAKEIPTDINYSFSCNCILNFLKLDLEGKKIGNITGPITFGEIAYQLLNQTLVNMEIRDI